MTTFEGCDKTGRYLGVNGYFLYGEDANWELQILSLSFVQQSKQTSLQTTNALGHDNLML